MHPPAHILPGAPGHEFRLAHKTQPAMGFNYIGYFLPVLFPENGAIPFHREISGGIIVESIEIPGESEPEIHLHLTCLDISRIENPVSVSSCAVCLGKFLVHQDGRSGAEPQISMRRSQIGDMIVDSAPAAAPGLQAA